MQAIIPLDFSDVDDPEQVLRVSTRSSLVTVEWAELGISLVHSKKSEPWESPKLDDISKNTPTFWSLNGYGFNIGKYTEVFVLENAFNELVPAILQIGSVEATVGHATPLFQYVMDGYHDRDVQGEWESVWTLRIWNCSLR